jgi:hypothetical protein
MHRNGLPPEGDFARSAAYDEANLFAAIEMRHIIGRLCRRHGGGKEEQQDDIS